MVASDAYSNGRALSQSEQVTSQLVEAIRSKRPVEELLQVLESSHLPAVQGDDDSE